MIYTKQATTSERLKELMAERNIRQIDIIHAAQPFCEKYGVKIGKADISQYVSGKVVPGQDKLAVLGMALNVSEAWLMGYNVSKSRTVSYTSDELIDVNISGAKNWATDFRFSDRQKTDNRNLADSAARLKQVVNAMANSDQNDGKILQSPELQQALNDISSWTYNGLKYVNEDYSSDPFDESNIREQYLSAISKLSRRDQVAWLIRIQDYIDELANKEESK